MLRELAIRDFAIIRELRLRFGPGMNALTGETGAGKSIIIDALGAVLGARASADLVRSGASSAWVEAVYDVAELAERDDWRQLLSETGIEPEDGQLILSRDIGQNGRSVARINSRGVTASVLGRVGELLVDIHGQSDHLSLLRPAEQLDMLDRYAGATELRQQVAGLVRDYRAVREQLASIASSERERAQRVDLLQFQVNEIESARLQPAEEEELQHERAILGNAERLRLLASEAYQILEGDELGSSAVSGTLDGLRQVIGRVEELATVDTSNEGLASSLRDAQFAVEDAALSLRNYLDAIEADPARLAVVEDRLDALRQLKRKYGASVEEVIAFGEQAQSELEQLDNSEQRVEQLHARSAALLNNIGELAKRLSQQRMAAASSLEAAVVRSMSELNMGRSQFIVAFDRLSGQDRVTLSIDGAEQEVPFDQTGIDRVVFLIAPNAGEAPKPLARTASGGETARLMLALKSILSEADATPTLVFDEIDVGVGGRSGRPVGEKLWGLSTSHQVIVISHLPQIAAFAEAHFRIAKVDRDGHTETHIDPLSNQDRVDELAAMLDGVPVTKASRQNALEMLSRIEDWKRGRSAVVVGPGQ